MKPVVLVVEDDMDLREAICDTLELGGYEILSAENGQKALMIIDQEDVDLVISDVQMDQMDGHTLLKNIKTRRTDLPVLLMTAYGTIQNAIKAIQDGAIDYLVKPFESTVLVSKVAQIMPQTLAMENGVIAEDERMKDVLGVARRVANSDATVMITGESGTGKEVLFRYLHKHSDRANKEAVAINCAAIPDNMLEAVLFGYEKGSFTGAYKASPGKFEQAQGSTLLLDEVSEMDLGLQAKILRVLQERQVERLGGSKVIDLDVRVVATSNRDLKTEVREGRFREDLFYRLNVFPIKMPALRQRPDDVIPLAEFLLSRSAKSGTTYIPELNESAINKLESHTWPGNVRELDNVMQRALIMQNGDEITAADLMFEALDDVQPLEMSQPLAASISMPEEATNNSDQNLGNNLKDQEQQLIVEALEECNGSRKDAAIKLGISPRTLRYKLAKMRDLGIAIPA